MSQPEMQPEEAPRRKDDPKEVRELGGGDDLRARPFPLGGWREPAERLDKLYHWAEAGALSTVDWYLRDRLRKRRAARALRFAAVASGAAGAVLPMVELAGDLAGGVEWGFVALLVAGVCTAADRLFGLTSGWIRDIGTAQALQRRLEAFQFEWESESVREVLGPTEGTASEAAERCLAVLRRFCEDVSDTVRTETAAWMLEFRGPLLQLQPQPPSAWEGRGEAGFVPARMQPPPGSRPSMPRQRPPEAR